jgi:hypothetical protein
VFIVCSANHYTTEAVLIGHVTKLFYLAYNILSKVVLKKEVIH